jgi:integrase
MAKKLVKGEEKKEHRRGKGEGSIYQRPDGTWAAQVSTGHDPKTGKLKRRTFYGKTRGEVAQKLNETINQVEKGQYVEPSNVTVKQWFRDWLEPRKPHIEESTYNKYHTIIENHIIPDCGEMKLKLLTTKHIQDLINLKFESGRVDGKGGLSRETLECIRQTFKLALDKAVREKVILFNPVGPKMIEIRDTGKRKMKTLDQDEMDKFLGGCKDSIFFPAFILESVTGLRRGEILGLQWQDFDSEKRTIHIQRQLTPQNKLIEKVKTEESDRGITLDPEVVELLKAHKTKQEQLKKWFLKDAYQDNDLIFCWEDGRSVTPRVFLRHFKTLLKESGITKDLRFHDMRHTFATLAIESGIPIKTVQEMLGHENIETTLGTYAHVTKLMQDEAAEIMTGRISKHIKNLVAVNKQ